MVSAISLPETVPAVLMTMYDSKEPLQSGLFRQTDIERVDDDLEDHVSMVNTADLMLQKPYILRPLKR